MKADRIALVSRSLAITLALCGLFALVGASNPAISLAGEAKPVDPLTPSSPVVHGPADLNFQVRLPLIDPKPELSTRLGFGTASLVSRFPGVETLRAGWYMDWQAQRRPARPNGMEYVQTIRVHQKLITKSGCEFGNIYAHDRGICPYALPYDYVYWPDKVTIKAVAEANRGSIWLIGNEMDRRDWPGGGQDEMLPEVYARVYHDLYYWIKAADPAAKVAIGGVIQATPERLKYLTAVWNTYLSTFGTQTMPVDVWNVHNFILKEKLNDYGAGIPPGSNGELAVEYKQEDGGDDTHVSLAIFGQQIRAFRAWMSDRGQQNKPLIVSEYGVLYHHIASADTPEEVQAFMVSTFEYFLNAADCALGYVLDGCRLVQRWAWYSLEDAGLGFNPYGSLFNQQTTQITTTGIRYRDWSLANLDRLKK